MDVITAAFDRAVHYDAHAAVQRDVAMALADYIVTLDLPSFPRILEIGCGTGFLTHGLVDRLPGADWLVTDISRSMLDRCRLRFDGRTNMRFAVMDGEAPTEAGPFDLICSSLAAQWFDDLPRALVGLRRLLTPQGRLVIATLADGSFAEWRAAHGSLRAGTPTFPSSTLLTELQMAVTETTWSIAYPDARSFLRSLKAIGAGTPHATHRPLSPVNMRGVMDRFEQAGAIARYVVAICTGTAVS